MGLTSMDYSKVSLLETSQILETGIRMVLHEGMTEDYMVNIAAAIRKVAEHYAT